MKTTYAVIVCAMLLLVSACAQKGDNPADVQAIKKLSADWDNAYNAGNIDGLLACYTNDVIRLQPNEAATVGKDVMRASFQSYFDAYKGETHGPIEDVRVSGNLAVARGIYTGTSTPKAGGTPINEKGKWISAYQRQADGPWKIFWDTGNSDLPAAEAPPVGKDELTLLQLERDWAEALVKKDTEALDKMLATEFQANYVDNVGNKKQYLSVLKSNTSKTESAVNSEMKVIVFGDRAIVNGLATEKSSMAGKDTSGRFRWTDVFVKREGRWQCVTGYAAKVE
jgi:uncharacterized protein (TIGR02246 family)